MRAQVASALDELLDDARSAPWMAEVAFASAVMTLTRAGIRVIREKDAD